MKALLLVFLFLGAAFSASADSLSDQDVLDACKRGPNRKIWVDRPTEKFYNHLRSLGYDSMESTGIAYKVCRDKRVSSNITDTELKKGPRSPELKSYIRKMREEINGILNTCKPGALCNSYSLSLPLEGVRNDNSVCGAGTVIVLGDLPLCRRGPTHKVWIDRPTPEFYNFLRAQKGYGTFKALGIAYRVCRDVDLAYDSSLISPKLNSIYRSCSPSRPCGEGNNFSFPYEGYRNDNTQGMRCNY